MREGTTQTFVLRKEMIDATNNQRSKMFDDNFRIEIEWGEEGGGEGNEEKGGERREARPSLCSV
jgi:hypothetical protein